MTIGVDPQTHKATRIPLFGFGRPHMRVFHMSWMAFFLAFFGWFGIAPMMAVVRDDLQLSKAEIGNTVIASVAVTIVARLMVGWLCDRIGPRITYSGLLIVGSIPVMTIGLANSYESFLLFRLAIGIIGASFVITQYHTSVMFAPNVMGTANATTAGWGNMGGGVTQMAMPLVLGVIVALGATDVIGWRIAMVVPGVALFLMGIAYFKFTQDSPDPDLAKAGREKEPPGARTCASIEAAKDHRVWALFLIYGACFGVELTMNNIAALYYHDRFGLGVGMAGLIAGLFGLMNLFARSLGGFISDKVGIRFGLRGRTLFLGGSAADRRHRVGSIFPNGPPAAGYWRHAGLQPVRADVRGRDVLGGAFRQPESAGGRGRHRGRGGQRRGGGCRVPVPHGVVEHGDGPALPRRHCHGRLGPGAGGALLPGARNRGAASHAARAGTGSAGGVPRPRQAGAHGPVQRDLNQSQSGMCICRREGNLPGISPDRLGP